MNIYSTFYHAPKPEGIEQRKAHIVGGGLAGLAAAAFLVDDAGMPGENITIYEKSDIFGGACDATQNEKGYICRGHRELEPYMECFWYLFSKIPSLEEEGRTVLDESVDDNKEYPMHSECRVLVNQGHIYERIHDFKESSEVSELIQKFLSEPEENLDGLSVEDYFGKGSPFFESSMWLCFSTMLAFKPCHSAIEAQRYLLRFPLANRIDYLEGILHGKRNDYDSFIKPLLVWLQGKGVKLQCGCYVYDLDLDANCNTVQGIHIRKNNEELLIPVSENDLVFVTNGSITTNSRHGDNNTVAPTVYAQDDIGLFGLWRNLAKKDAKFGNPDVFTNDIDTSKWLSFMLTIKDFPEFFAKLKELTGSKAGTGASIAIRDSDWGLTVEMYNRNYYPDQEETNRDVFFGYGLYAQGIGNYIKKPMCECTGEEIVTEVLYHLNLLDWKDELLKHTYVSTTMMPYINSEFAPRKKSNRPKNVPDGCTNLAFLGQFAEVDDDCAFTVELSVRTALEGVYKLTHLDKDILEVYPAKYDIRYKMEQFKKHMGLRQGEKLTKEHLPKMNPFKMNAMLDELLEELNNIPPYYIMYPGRDKSVAQKEAVLNPQYPKYTEK